MGRINKIAIFGSDGSGKTRLTKILQQELRIPKCHLDSINYKENLQKEDPSLRDKKILTLTEKERWILDGNYIETLEKRIQTSDLNIFLDFPIHIMVLGLLERQIKGNGNQREDIPGCIEKIDFKYIIDKVKEWKELKAKIYEIIYRNKDKNVVILKSRDAVNKYIEIIKVDEESNNIN